ncbi:MAG: hypothetical protein L0Y66_09505 [Myxococcaceae bacterium]|nr:hypothetical protein [Myxococcaceae bacterium]
MSARLPLVALLVLLAGCTRGEGVPMDLRHQRGGGTPVATFGDDAITSEELTQRLLEMTPYLRTRYQTPEQKREYVEGLTRFELLAREAARRGLQNDPEVVASTKKAMVHRLLQKELEEKGSPITDAEIAAYHEQHRAEFLRPEEVKLEEPRTRTRIIQSIRAERQQRDYEALLARLTKEDALKVNEEALAKVEVDLKAPTRAPSGPAPGFIPAPSAQGGPAALPARVPPFPTPH